MFTERSLDGEVAAVRETHAPEALVLDCERDFETLPPAAAEDLALVTDALSPASYPEEWVPPEAPELLARYAGGEFTVGLPGDGSVAWTRQTTPPVVLVKPRLEGSPDTFADFLLAEALVEAGSDLPEGFLPFFGERYGDLAAATRDHLDPAGTYQLAAALFDAYKGLHTREVFGDWRDPSPELFDAWHDAGERLEPRLSGLSSAVASGRTDFPDAAELACSAVKHALELPTPFDPLDTGHYREHGADYAVEWAETTFERL
jgi:hypothetical protein